MSVRPEPLYRVVYDFEAAGDRPSGLARPWLETLAVVKRARGAYGPRPVRVERVRIVRV